MFWIAPGHHLSLNTPPSNPNTMLNPSESPSSASSPTYQLVDRIGNQFAVQGKLVASAEIDSGHINSTYCGSYLQADGSVQRYIFQSINRNVFKDPFVVMKNVEQVTRHINSKVLRNKRDLGGQTLNLFPARTGGAWVEDTDGGVWRCYNFIEGCVTYDVVENTRQAYQAARAFGSFQDLVSDMDASLIKETIPDFHHTVKRFQRLLDVADDDPVGRLASVRAEFDFALSRQPITGVLLDAVAAGKIPVRVTHNDTKINNVMIDAESDEAVCVIDLDTVMPGLALYDFGDLVRSATSPAAEDEQDLSKVRMQMPLFEALVEGYLDSASEFINEVETAHLAFSGKLMTFEVGIRFLTDHLEGDVYFKTHRPDHNLDRCRTQFKLVECIESQEPAMTSFIHKVRKSNR